MTKTRMFAPGLLCELTNRIRKHLILFIIGCGCLFLVLVNQRAIADSVKAKKKYPPGKLGEIVRLGESLVNETNHHSLTEPFVGNSLKCTSCHLDAGRHEKAGSFIGVSAA